MTKVTFVVSWMDATLPFEHLKTCLESLKRQTEIISEIFLFSNFKKNVSLEDETKSYLNQHVVYKNYPKLSLGELQNIGLEQATGDYICFVSPRDFLVEEAVAKLFLKTSTSPADLIIGQALCYDAKAKTVSFKEKNTMPMIPTTMVTESGMVYTDLLEDMTLTNKLFRVAFLKEQGLKFSTTTYGYDFLFQLKALVHSKMITTTGIHFYNERIFSGLAKLQHPTLAEAIDEKQVKDMLQVFNESTQWSEEMEIECLQQFVLTQQLEFIFKRGLNYLNISSQPEVLFKRLGESLGDLAIPSLKRSARQKKILMYLKANDYEGYRAFLANEKLRKAKQKSLPKHLKRQLFVGLYQLGCKLPVKKRHVLFVSHSPGMDGNYAFIQAAIEDYNQTARSSDRFRYQNTSTKISAFQKLFLPLQLARAEFVLAAEYLPFLQLLEMREETKVVQTWHAAGAFKKFGYSTNYLSGGPNPFKNLKMHLHRGYDYATVSSEEVRKHYAEAFEMDIEKVLPVGLPRADFFYQEEQVSQTQAKLYELYPMLKGKKVILYAPTFRGVGKTRANFKMEFDVNRIAREISDEYMIALKLHPSVQSSDIVIEADVENKIVDLSPYKEANDVLTITDLLITDYSSIIFDYSLLKKPMLFYAYDLEDYRFDRDFYYDYETFVPGPIARTNDDIIELINQGEFDLDRVEQFSQTFFASQTGDHSKRFVEEVLVKLSQS